MRLIWQAICKTIACEVGYHFRGGTKMFPCGRATVKESLTVHIAQWQKRPTEYFKVLAMQCPTTYTVIQ